MQTPNAGISTNVRSSNDNNDYALNDTVKNDMDVSDGGGRRENQSIQRKKKNQSAKLNLQAG